MLMHTGPTLSPASFPGRAGKPEYEADVKNRAPDSGATWPRWHGAVGPCGLRGGESAYGHTNQ